MLTINFSLFHVVAIRILKATLVGELNLAARGIREKGQYLGEVDMSVVGRKAIVGLWVERPKASMPGPVSLPLAAQYMPVVDLQILGSHQRPNLRHHGQLEQTAS